MNDEEFKIGDKVMYVYPKAKDKINPIVNVGIITFISVNSVDDTRGYWIDDELVPNGTKIHGRIKHTRRKLM